MISSSSHVTLQIGQHHSNNSYDLVEVSESLKHREHIERHQTTDSKLMKMYMKRVHERIRYFDRPQACSVRLRSININIHDPNHTLWSRWSIILSSGRCSLELGSDQL